MPKTKHHLKEFIIWGSETPENKNKAIQAFAFAIHTLTNTDKKLDERDLEKITGGLFGVKDDTTDPNCQSCHTDFNDPKYN